MRNRTVPLVSCLNKTQNDQECTLNFCIKPPKKKENVTGGNDTAVSTGSNETRCEDDQGPSINA